MEKMIGIALEKEGLYHLIPASSQAKTCNSFQFNSAPLALSSIHKHLDIWHCRLGHVSSSRFHSLKQIDSAITLDHTNVCDICPLAKQRRLPFSVSQSNSNKSFDLIHCDIWGPFGTTSYSGFRYFLTIVDDFTRCTWVYMIKAKSEVPSLIKNFCKMVANQFSSSVKAIRSDNGPEFLLTKFYHKYGILHQRSCVETPQQNGVVERKHQHLLSTARALMFQANLPLIFWSDCVLTAAHIINRIPTPLLQNKTPFEMLFNKTPNLSHLRVFGCLCFASTLTSHRQKFDSRATKCIFLGYPSDIKGYKLMDLNTNKILVSRNVIFHETIFPFQVLPQHPETHSFMFPLSQSFSDSPSTTSFFNSYHNVGSASPPNNSPSLSEPPALLESNSPTFPSPSHVDSTDPKVLQLRKSTRIKQKPSYLQDYYCGNVSSSQNATQASTSLDCSPTEGNFYSLHHFLSTSRLSTSHKAFLTSITNSLEPKSYTQASRLLE